jgi:radical SAM superfamily enzyme YgiQ (UPF0313 family)
MHDSIIWRITGNRVQYLDRGEKMRIILATLNSKFIHSNLAIRYLKSYTENINPIEIKEFTINQNIDFIVSEIYKMRPDILGFSTYIWNLEETLQVAETIKMVNPDTKILLGGPEVSFDGEYLLNKYSYIDYIIYGEGEESFKELIELSISGGNFKDILGLIYREDKIIKNPPRPLIKDLDTIPSPYRNISNEFDNKIVYYESSRGCPFNCEFCLSSTIKGVRYFSLDRIKEDLKILIESKVRQVKFVDRTFNANKRQAIEIMKYIIEEDPEDINFHFEITAHLIDEEMLQFLRKPKEGLFQFEIGVQSTNEETIDAVGRVTDFEELKRISKTIKSFRNIHQHLDLIAGLPYENYDSFKKSFNDVYGIKPEKLQLGFLKLLKGSGLRLNEKKYGYKYLDKPPYEVLENNYINYTDIIKLKAIEDLVDKYYNEEYFSNSLEFIIKNFYDTPFDFYEDFSIYWEDNGFFKVAKKRSDLYQILLDFYLARMFSSSELFEELLKYDYIKNNKNMEYPKTNIENKNMISQKYIHEILKDERIIDNYLKRYKGIPTKKIIKNIIIEGFNYDVMKVIAENYKVTNKKDMTYILFDFTHGKLVKCNTFDISKIVKELI